MKIAVLDYSVGEVDIINAPEMETWSSDSPYQRYLIEEVERKIPKRYQEFVDKVNKNAQAIARAFEKRDYDAVWQYV